MSNDSRALYQIVVRVTPETKKALQAVCKTRGRSMNNVLNRMISRLIQNEREKATISSSD